MHAHNICASVVSLHVGCIANSFPAAKLFTCRSYGDSSCTMLRAVLCKPQSLITAPPRKKRRRLKKLAGRAFARYSGNTGFALFARNHARSEERSSQPAPAIMNLTTSTACGEHWLRPDGKKVTGLRSVMKFGELGSLKERGSEGEAVWLYNN